MIWKRKKIVRVIGPKLVLDQDYAFDNWDLAFCTSIIVFLLYLEKSILEYNLYSRMIFSKCNEKYKK